MDIIEKIEKNEEGFLEAIDVDIQFKLNLEEVRTLSRYLEGEVVVGLEENIAMTAEAVSEAKKSYYEEVKKVVNHVANGIYKGLITAERLVIDELKQKEIAKEDIIMVMSRDQYEKERIENIYTAMDEMGDEEQEAKDIYEKIDDYGKEILDKLKEKSDPSLYLPLIYKFFWLLYSSMDFNGEIVFTQNSIEEILNLDREGVEGFLDVMSGIEVELGEVNGRIVEHYSYLNSSTIKIEYSIFAVNPQKYMGIHEGFVIDDKKMIEVNFVNE